MSHEEHRMCGWLFAPFAAIGRHWEILARATTIALKTKFAGSLLGLIWLVVGPLLLLSLYATIYAVIFKIRPTGMTQIGYVLYVFSGLVPFLAFSAGLTAGTMSLTVNKELLLNTVFPAEFVPLREVLSNSLTIVTGLALVAIINLVVGTYSIWWLLLPVVILFQLMFVTGIVWLLSLANLVIRDIEQLLSLITIALLIVTPIAYTPDMIPASLKAIIYVNPLSYYVIAFQYILVLNTMPPIEILIIGSVISIFSFCGGYYVFRRAKQVMFDYV